ncbi:hypothetical protein [Nostoc sp.]|uniref:hypothetical protein n=1 Tax=Nostoc sp. TaxID=1180 RepID=UPI002FF09BE8
MSKTTAISTELLENIFDLTSYGFEASVRDYLPDSTYRNYCLWALSTENPHQKDYLQVLGFKQFAQLTLTLFDGLVKDSNQEKLAKFSAPMNVYLTYENISDNLAIGLANQASDDTTYTLRRDVLLAFNETACKRLLGQSKSAEQLLAPVQHKSQCISGFWQSHNPVKHKAISQTYLNLHPHISDEDIEYGVWPCLVANIETCVAVAESVASYSVGSLVSQGLINRYRAVSALLEEPEMTLSRRVKVGTDSILVIPTLAYYISVLAEIVQPIDNFQNLVKKSQLVEALNKAALLVRLTNDLGMLVTQTKDERISLIDKLQVIYRKAGGSIKTINELLLQAAQELSSVLARIYKDTQLREFNVCLGDIELVNALSVDEALVIFEQRLEYFSQLYAQTRAQMMTLLEDMSDLFGDNRPSLLISRFVIFHEQLYAYPYNQPTGEYCI